MITFESKFSAAVGNTLKFKVKDPNVSAHFLYYWVQHLYNMGKLGPAISGSVIPGAAISRIKKLPFYDKTLGDVADISTTGDNFDFEMARTGQNAGKVIEKTASHTLLAAASEAKKDALAKKYTLERGLLDQLADIDPTPNGVYTEWLAKHYKTGALGELGDSNFPSYTEKLVVFERLKNSPQFKAQNSADINSYTPSELIEVVDKSTLQDLSKNEQLREIEREKDKYLMDGVDFLGSRGGLNYYRVNEVEAAMIMSQGTHWCTKGQEHARNYLENASLYDITRPGTHTSPKNYGDSDKVAQLYVPDRSTRIECQTIEGYDIGRHEGDRYVVTNYGAWEWFEFLHNFDSNISRFMDNDVLIDEERYYELFTTCDQCDRNFESGSDDSYYDERQEKEFCSESCWKDSNENYIEETVEELIPAEDPAVIEEAQKKIDFFINSPDSPQAKVFDEVKEAIVRFNTKNPDKPIPTPVDTDWHLTNLRSAVRTNEKNLERVFGKPITNAFFQEAYYGLTSLVNESKTREALVDDAIDYVKGEFNYNDTNIEEILTRGGFLPAKVEDPKTSSWQSSLLSKEAASEAKMDALAAKYGLSLEIVEFLADEADPTPNGEYLEWLCKQQKKGETKGVGAQELKTTLEQFTRFKRPGTPFREKNSGDINSYSYPTLLAAIQASSREDLSKKEQVREVERQKEKYLMDGCHFLARKDDLALYKVTTVEASMLMSKGTHWCTQGEAHAKTYLNDGELFIVVIDKAIVTRNNYNAVGPEYQQPGESDKLLQVFVPADEPLQRLECQDPDGNDIGERWESEEDGGDTVIGYQVVETGVVNDFDLLKWIAGYSPDLKELIASGVVFADTGKLMEDLSLPVWKTTMGARLLAKMVVDYNNPNRPRTIEEALKICPEFIYLLYGYGESEPTQYVEQILDGVDLRTSNYGNLLWMNSENYAKLGLALDQSPESIKSKKIVAKGWIFNVPSTINFSSVNQDMLFDSDTILKELLGNWKFSQLPSDMQTWFEDEFEHCSNCGELIVDSDDAVRNEDGELLCGDNCWHEYEDAKETQQIEDDVEEIMVDYDGLPTEESIAEATAAMVELTNPETTPLKKSVVVVINALEKAGKPVSPDSIIANLRSAFNTWTADHSLEQVFPGMDREEFKEAWQLLADAKEGMRSKEEVLKDAISYVKSQGGYTNFSAILRTLQKGGFIPEDSDSQNNEE